MHDSLTTEFRNLVDGIHDGYIVGNGRRGAIHISNLNGSVDGREEGASGGQPGTFKMFAGLFGMK